MHFSNIPSGEWPCDTRRDPAVTSRTGLLQCPRGLAPASVGGGGLVSSLQGPRFHWDVVPAARGPVPVVSGEVGPWGSLCLLALWPPGWGGLRQWSEEVTDPAVGLGAGTQTASQCHQDRTTHRWCLLRRCPRSASRRGHCARTAHQQAALTLRSIRLRLRDTSLQATPCLLAL